MNETLSLSIHSASVGLSIGDRIHYDLHMPQRSMAHRDRHCDALCSTFARMYLHLVNCIPRCPECVIGSIFEHCGGQQMKRKKPRM
ncbi:hypothetical protein BDR04DRAFT_1098838 [Suillus decipiens]|nr:hypothetical protein BDR04DRAFT_1098838 [Suillus decipiens]